MNLPAPFYARAFWEAVSITLAGVLALLAFLGYVNPEWAIPASVILTWVLGLLRMFGIEPELRARLLEKNLRRIEALLQEAAIVRNDLLDTLSRLKREQKAKSK
jgi:hypothetical protein